MEILNNTLLIINALACAAIAIRLFIYRRQGAKFRRLAGICAWALMIACSAIFIQIAAHQYKGVNWAETLINVALCVNVIAARGNVMRIVNPVNSEQR